jgi:hypothetical protein
VHDVVSFQFVENYIVPEWPDSPAQRSYNHPYQTFQLTASGYNLFPCGIASF